jgi:hypothetical protein
MSVAASDELEQRGSGVERAQLEQRQRFEYGSLE